MYRAVALSGAARSGRRCDIRFDGDRVLLDGEDVSDAIRTPEVSQEASRRAADPAVRAALVDKQRALIAERRLGGRGPRHRHRRRARRRAQGVADGRRGRARPAPRRARRPRSASATSATRAASTRRWSPRPTPSRSTPPAWASTRSWRGSSSSWGRGRREGRGRRLSQRRQVLARQPPDRLALGGRPRARRASRATATRSPCEWNGRRFDLIDTGGMDFLDVDPIAGSIREQAQAALNDARRGDPRRRRARRAPARATRSSPTSCAAGSARSSSPPTRSTRSGDMALAAEFHASASATRSRCRPPRASDIGDLLDRVDRRAARRGRPARGGGRRHPPGDRRAPERRQVDARQPPAGRRARDRLRRRRHHARRDRPAARGRRAQARDRRHRRPAPAGQGLRLGRVLHDAALPARGRARRRRARRLRRPRRRHRARTCASPSWRCRRAARPRSCSTSGTSPRWTRPTSTTSARAWPRSCACARRC